ncbi:MAG: hypothetical protein WCT12_19105, partial [Verrucomicrobiota bacterium]
MRRQSFSEKWPGIQPKTHESTGGNGDNGDNGEGKTEIEGGRGGVNRELGYHRFFLFKPKPMNQQEETEITEI